MIKSVKITLRQLLGDNYIDAVVKGAKLLYGESAKTYEKLACEPVDFLPEANIKRTNELLLSVGREFAAPIIKTIKGAATLAFEKATKIGASPLCGLGFLRLGEDGRLYLIAKSEHYHAPLGHSFPGYKLIDNAKALGITNTTHNNTRGYITRLLEMELVRTVNGLPRSNRKKLAEVIASREPRVLNRVINLETGSLACEAGIKMMLARFYKIDKSLPEPKYSGRIPVFFVIGDDDDESSANYHGTTVTTQMMRNLWPDMYSKFEQSEVFKIRPVRINDYNDFKTKFAQYNSGKYKAAGFLHEIILMNYSGIKLNVGYLHKIYKLCHDNDTPVMCDEIQSCMWSPELYLFREYGLDPDFVVIGKGFPGGQYPASRIITTYEMDNLNLFGALVTNGQEELAALAYLITMEFVQKNGMHIIHMRQYYGAKLQALKNKYPGCIEKIEGLGHLSSICFYKTDDALRFASMLNGNGIDISAQSYKAKCPPAVLTKIPIISTDEMANYLAEKMDEALSQL
ncbi:MAG: aminotransferase class III-fold pyridoxal phosphate-dependent enzyme [Eubacteriales bacterium]|nr:aminotransferase class III-fold pyridoxal phosphate-dependent enzyme [Eubacteriales bacterium]